MSSTFLFPSRPSAWAASALSCVMWICTLLSLPVSHRRLPSDLRATSIGRVRYLMQLYKPSQIDLQVDGASLPHGTLLSAQLRVDGMVLEQASSLHYPTDGVSMHPIALSLRPIGQLEVRVAAMDDRGCVQASGVTKLRALAEPSLQVPVRLVPLATRYCPTVRPPLIAPVDLPTVINPLGRD